MLRAYLRSFPGARLTLLIPAFYLALIAVSGRWAFIGDAYLTLELLPNAAIYVLSVTAALSAYDTALVARPEMSSVLTLMPRGRIARFIPALAVAASSAMLHTLTSVGMLALGGITDPRAGWGMVIWTLAVQSVTFAVMALLGAVIAFVATPRVAPFLAFLVAFVYIFAATLVDGSPMVRALGSSIRQIWWTWNPDYRLVQSALLIASVCTLAFALAMFRPGQGSHSKSDYVRLTAVGLVLSIGFLLPHIPYTTDVVPTPARTFCTGFSDSKGERLEFCGYPEDERYLPYIEGVIILGREFLDDAGYLLDEMPRRFESEAPEVSDSPDPDVIYLGLPSDVWNSLVVQPPTEVGVPEVELIANRFVVPSACIAQRVQDRLFREDSDMEDVYDSLVSAAFDVFYVSDGADERLSPEEFAANYRELAAWCAE